MKKINKKGKILIIVLSIVVLVTIVSLSIILPIVLEKQDIKPPPKTPSDDDGTIVKEFYVAGGIKEEYYLNEYFDINDIIVFVKYKDGDNYVQTFLNVTPSFFFGYPETPLPNTSTIGYKSFKLIYLDGVIETGFNVVAFNENHYIDDILNKVYLKTDSVFDLLFKNAELKDDTLTNDYVETIYDKIANNGILTYLNDVNNFIKIVKTDLTPPSIYQNPSSSKQAYLNINDDSIVGAYWTKLSESEEYNYFTFEVNNINQLQGLEVEITLEGKTYTILSNYDNGNFNMVIKGALELDVLINYSPTKFYLSKDSTSNNDNLSNLAYSELFGTNAQQVLEYDIANNTYNFK